MTTSNEQIDFTHWLYRLIAYIIDSIIIGIPAAIIYFVVILAAIVANPFIIVYGGWLILPFLFGILQFLYFMILDTAWGGTIGKRVMGLQVQMVNGGKASYGKSFIRNISKIYGLFLFLDWLIGVVTTGDKRQKYTDRIAGTIVIQARQAFQSTPPPPPPPPPT
jgi:uncharacterized RDD family membrane protein YckC